MGPSRPDVPLSEPLSPTGPTDHPGQLSPRTGGLIMAFCPACGAQREPSSQLCWSCGVIGVAGDEPPSIRADLATDDPGEAKAAEPAPRCSRCHGPMQEGFLVDFAYYEKRVQEGVEGRPEPGGLTGIRDWGRTSRR